MVNKRNFWTIPPTDLKGHRKYFGKFGHICQLIPSCLVAILCHEVKYSEIKVSKDLASYTCIRS